ncbi:carbohydrate ABC transporter permease [Paenibacillus thalictri]|uniref:Carbohydrate ABC transporter permease n=1 Tax=Paenibacillus thalictri TaxID=2527873 RepID=A0A4Q9DWP5_9BACL|nr:carbohydrate ABC transporter permease [Paenibacillus thalictri]TBL81507.1 carbohydrate ABC transporter permease [Paenibacillus thalictri]
MDTFAKSRGDRLFDFLNYCLFSVILLVVLYPLYFIIIASFSDPNAISEGEVWLIPQHITFEGYQRIMNDPTIWSGYTNSILYTLVGTGVNIVLTLPAAYALSRSDLVGRKIVLGLILFTMFFSGGLIPSYLLVKSLGLLNTIWALVLPNGVVVYYLIIARTFFQVSIPDTLLEAAQMDGCSNTRFFAQVVFPLSLPIIAVMVLFHAVMHWNSYFAAMIYIKDKNMLPLQLILRDILISSQQGAIVGDVEDMVMRQRVAELVKYGVVIVGSLPVLILYPFLQKYFVKGIMIGAIKG